MVTDQITALTYMDVTSQHRRDRKHEAILIFNRLNNGVSDCDFFCCGFVPSGMTGLPGFDRLRNHVSSGLPLPNSLELWGTRSATLVFG
jgi:hypothetical protein